MRGGDVGIDGDDDGHNSEKMPAPFEPPLVGGSREGHDGDKAPAPSASEPMDAELPAVAATYASDVLQRRRHSKDARFAWDFASPTHSSYDVNLLHCLGNGTYGAVLGASITTTPGIDGGEGAAAGLSTAGVSAVGGTRRYAVVKIPVLRLSLIHI